MSPARAYLLFINGVKMELKIVSCYMHKLKNLTAKDETILFGLTHYTCTS